MRIVVSVAILGAGRETRYGIGDFLQKLLSIDLEPRDEGSEELFIALVPTPRKGAKVPIIDGRAPILAGGDIGNGAGCERSHVDIKTVGGDPEWTADPAHSESGNQRLGICGRGREKVEGRAARTSNQLSTQQGLLVRWSGASVCDYSSWAVGTMAIKNSSRAEP